MAPKFRGGSDDWLDNENLIRKRSAGVKSKKGNAARSLELPWEDSNAVVAEVFPNKCRVQFDDQVELLCSYRRAGVVGKGKSEIRERTPVAVGDRVLAQSTGNGTGVIDGVAARRNCISRPAPGKESDTFQHVLAANIDLLVIVASCLEPEFSPGLVDRFLVSAEAEKVQVCICITKIDLLKEVSQLPNWALYKDLNYPIYEVSPKLNLGVPELEKELVGKTVVFCGQSGVGKTSLLRTLLKSDVGRVGSVSDSTGKGRHTTTGAILLGGPGDSQWIDTPGVREFGLSRVTPEQLASCFPELNNLDCGIKDCLHYKEADCKAFSLPRYPSYRRILESLIAGEN